jgi:membrane protease YdiL (CAAX protease family)
MSYGTAIAWTAAVTVLLQVVLKLTALVRPSAQTDVVNLGASEALAFMIGILVVVRLYAPEASFRQAVGLRRTSPGLLVLGLALGFCVHFPAESLRVLMERFFPTPTEVLAARLELLRGDTPVEMVAILLVVACVGPLVEELFFRGALFSSLRRSRSLFGASLVTAVAFVLGHMDPRLWLPLLVVALVLAHLRAAGGSLLPCLALHVGFNTVTVLAIATGAAPATSPMELDPPATAAGWIVTAALVLWVHLVAAKSEEAAQARAEDAG